MVGFEYLAIYGAVLSTIAIGWNIYNNLQDKPKIEITTSFGGITDNLDKTLFIITAINRGKRSVHLSAFGLRTEDGLNLIPNRITGVPCELGPGKSHWEFFEASKLEDKRFDFAWYRDETGKVYKSKPIGHKFDTYFERKPKKVKRKVAK